METKTNFGMKVKMTFNKFGTFKGEKLVLRNVTEIHYNYPSEVSGEKKIAFESDIHGTGVTYQLADLDEFEAKLETKIEKEF